MGYPLLEHAVWEQYSTMVRECAEMRPLVDPAEWDDSFMADMESRLDQYGRNWTCSEKQQEQILRIHSLWVRTARAGKLKTSRS